jgi:alpha-L-rhamnosidase
MHLHRLLLALPCAALALTLTPVNLTTNWLPPGALTPYAFPATPVFRFAALASPPDARLAAWEATDLEVCLTPACADGAAAPCRVTVPGASAAVLTCASPALAQPSALLYWRVRLQAGGAWGPFSQPAAFGTGLGEGPAAVGARWVAAPRALTGNASTRPVRLRAEVALGAAPLARAVLYLAAPGYYKLSCLGAPVSTHEYGPATEFTRRVLYTAHEVGACVSGAAALLTLGVRLGGGFWGHAPAFDAKALPLRAQLHLQYTNGTTAVLRELPWLAALDSLSYSDWYLGEASSALVEEGLAGWDAPGFPAAPPAWQPVEGDASPALATPPTLSPHDFPPIGPYATLRPVALSQPLPGEYVFAFPLNFAGVPLVSVPSPPSARGTVVQLYAGELLFPNGQVYNQLNGSTLQELNHTLAGNGGQEVLRPTFAFWGMQYLRLRGWPAAAPPPTLAAVSALAMSTEGAQSGFLTFDGQAPSERYAHSHVPPSRAGMLPLQQQRQQQQDFVAQELARTAAVNASVLAAVQALTLAGTRSNFFSVPSDCPTREKRGWMGDGASSVGQAARNFALPGAYGAWLRSMRDDQQVAPRPGSAAAGVLSVYVPRDGAGPPSRVTDASWALAAGEVLAQVLSVYGMAEPELAAAGVTLDALLAFLAANTDPATGVMSNQALFGDWCAQFDRVAYVNATKAICATASHMLLLDTGAAVASALNKSAAAAAYAARRAGSAGPFVRAYSQQGAGSSWTDGLEQTPAVMPLVLDFFPTPAARNATAAWLVHDIEVTRGGHWSTGSVGTRFILQQLSALGRSDLAAFLAAQDTFPSPGWWVRQGATTGWECWSGVADDTHPPPPTHNHPFLLAHGLWVWEGLAGLTLSSGGRVAALSPPLLTDLPAATAAWEGPLGQVASAWSWAGAPAASAPRLRLRLPPGSAAGTVVVPLPGWGAAGGEVAEGGVTFWRNGAFVPGAAPGVSSAVPSADGQAVVVSVGGSGDYSFEGSGPGGDAAVAPPRRAQCSPWRADAAAINVTCGSSSGGGGGRATVLRSGLFNTAARAAAFVERGEGLVGGAASLRFTLTHALQGGCSASRGGLEAALAAQGVALRTLEGVHEILCVEWLCPA